jgi:endonuclease/exonuclease/phosphatase family metal-dependent hydrolase
LDRGRTFVRVALLANIRPLHMRNLRLQESVLHGRLALCCLVLLQTKLPLGFFVIHLLLLLPGLQIALGHSSKHTTEARHRQLLLTET